MYSEVYVSRRKRGMNSMLRAGDAGAYWPEPTGGLEKDEAQCLECGDIYKYGEHHICPWERTLRDEFAMAAMSGLCAGERYTSDTREMALLSYLIADAMMEAR